MRSYNLVVSQTFPMKLKAERTSKASLDPAQLARFSARLQELQVQRKLTVREIAMRGRLSPGSVQKLLTGKQEPRLGTLFALMTAFELGSVESLLGDPPSYVLSRNPQLSQTAGR